MISFERKGTTIIAKIEANMGLEARFYSFEFNVVSEQYAYLLRENFANSLMSKLQAAREEAYLQGYKAAKAKAAKETWFSGHL